MSNTVTQSTEIHPYDLSDTQFMALTPTVLTTPLYYRTAYEQNLPAYQQTIQTHLNVGYGLQLSYNTFRLAMRFFGQGHFPVPATFPLNTKIAFSTRKLNYFDYKDLPHEFFDEHFLTQSTLNIADMGTNGLLTTFADNQISDRSFLNGVSTWFMGAFGIAGPGEALTHLGSEATRVMGARAAKTSTLNALQYTGDAKKTNAVLMAEGVFGNWLYGQQSASYERDYFSPYLNFEPTLEVKNDVLQSYADMMGCSLDDSACSYDANWLYDALSENNPLELETDVESFKEQYGLTDDDIDNMKELVVAADAANQTMQAPNLELGGAQQSMFGVARMQSIGAEFGYALLGHAALENMNGGFVWHNHLELGLSNFALDLSTNALRCRFGDAPFALASTAQSAAIEAAAIGSIRFSDGNVRLRRAYAFAGFDTIYSLMAPSIYHPLIYADNEQTDLNWRGKYKGNPLLNGMLGAEVLGLGGTSALTATQATALFWEGNNKSNINYQIPLMVAGANILLFTGATIYETRVKSMPESLAEYYQSEVDLNASRKKRMW